MNTGTTTTVWIKNLLKAGFFFFFFFLPKHICPRPDIFVFSGPVMSQEGVPQHSASCLSLIHRPNQQTVGSKQTYLCWMLELWVVKTVCVQAPSNHHRNDPDIVTEVEVILHLHWQVTNLTGISVFRDSTVQIHYNWEENNGHSGDDAPRDQKLCERLHNAALPPACTVQKHRRDKLSASHSTLILDKRDFGWDTLMSDVSDLETSLKRGLGRSKYCG